MRANLLLEIIAGVLFLAGMQTASSQVYHQLSAGEFQGIPRSASEDVIARTHCTIDYHYSANGIDGNYRLNFTIRAIMDQQRSWLKMNSITSQEMLARVLKHEQGHYAICYLEQQELLRVVGATVFTADYRREAQNILDRIDAKYKQLNLDYDTDTRHMQNQVQQDSWNVYFDKKIAYMPPDN